MKTPPSNSKSVCDFCGEQRKSWRTGWDDEGVALFRCRGCWSESEDDVTSPPPVAPLDRPALKLVKSEGLHQ